jgi:hypothetical protein
MSGCPSRGFTYHLLLLLHSLHLHHYEYELEEGSQIADGEMRMTGHAIIVKVNTTTVLSSSSKAMGE